MPSIYFCPNCWETSNEQAVICPHCHYDLTHYQSLTYDQKLIHALRHPVRENRMMAAQLLGDLRRPEAIKVFAEMLQTETDYYFIREIVGALRKISGKDSIALLRELQNHPSALVRQLVQNTLRVMS